MAETRPIIVIKKKVSHGGHHGGAWKVAYADFVTAMMALFIVLWLLNSSKQIREAVGGYFKDPTGTSKKVGNGQNGSGQNFELTRDNMDKIKEELEKSIRKVTTFDKFKDQIEMTVTADGLRIELLESEVGTFFQSGAPQPTENGKELLVKLAQELGKLPNRLFMEGHTDSKPFSSSGGYSNWELSADRANSARRLMQQNGLAADQVTQVRGFADQQLKKPDDPMNASNRRISLIVQYQVKPEPEEPEPAKEGEGHGGGEGHGEKPAHGEKAAEGGGHGAAEKPAAAGHGASEKPAEKPAAAAHAPEKTAAAPAHGATSQVAHAATPLPAQHAAAPPPAQKPSPTPAKGH